MTTYPGSSTVCCVNYVVLTHNKSQPYQNHRRVMTDTSKAQVCPPGPKDPTLYPVGPSGERIRPCMACKDTRLLIDLCLKENVRQKKLRLTLLIEILF